MCMLKMSPAHLMASAKVAGNSKQHMARCKPRCSLVMSMLELSTVLGGGTEDIISYFRRKGILARSCDCSR